ncbi:MAG: NAD(P)-dependent oxidoreductase [Eubacteriales bacterium]
MKERKSRVFPIFLNMVDKQILIVGYGNVGARRIKSLLDFSCTIKVVSPSVPKDVEEDVIFICDEFREEYLEHVDIVIAATNDRKVNEDIYYKCKEKGILVNVCDNKDLCDFYFPAIFQTDEIIGGLVSKTGQEHVLVRETASKIRSTI